MSADSSVEYLAALGPRATARVGEGIVALDLFAGTGWGVACHRLGIEEHGVEIMPEAVTIRQANGMHTIYRDVWEGLEGGDPLDDLEHAPIGSDRFNYALLIASPPCQTFSMAGNGKGRQALDEVVGLIDAKAYLDVAELRAFGERHDMRTALVLTPLAHVARDTPTYVVFEQVPQVLPVWERCAEELRKWGYSVWTGVLNSEQYGVPQTRRRAILIARADGKEAKPPTPTHSRYYSRNPKKLDEGVLPWVSMAEALGWGMTARPHMTVTGGDTATGGYEPFGHGARDAINREHDAGRWLESSYSSGGSNAVEREGSKTTRGKRDEHEPASTLTSKAGSMQWGGGLELVSNNKLAHSARRPLDEPAPTLTAGHDSGNRVWEERQPVAAARHRGAGLIERGGERRDRPVDEPALTLTGSASGTTPGGFGWVHADELDAPDLGGTSRHFVGNQTPPNGDGEKHSREGDKPAPTLTSGHRAAHWEERPATTPGHHDNQMKSATKVTVEEASALQSYPAVFDWSAVSKTKAFLQIGNAVPPTLAEAILREVLS